MARYSTFSQCLTFLRIGFKKKFGEIFYFKQFIFKVFLICSTSIVKLS